MIPEESERAVSHNPCLDCIRSAANLSRSGERIFEAFGGCPETQEKSLEKKEKYQSDQRYACQVRTIPPVSTAMSTVDGHPENLKSVLQWQ